MLEGQLGTDYFVAVNKGGKWRGSAVPYRAIQGSLHATFLPVPAVSYCWNCVYKLMINYDLTGWFCLKVIRMDRHKANTSIHA